MFVKCLIMLTMKMEDFNMIKFGTGGWREIIGDQFTKENVQKIATALTQMIDQGPIIIGYDRRFMSKEAAYWFIQTLVANKIDTYLIDKPSPTPIVMFAIKEQKTQYGVAITASHNPAIYNGIKLFVEGGKDATLGVTQEIEQKANQVTEVKSMEWYEVEESPYFHRFNPDNEYIDSILDSIDQKAIRDAHLRIVIDPMHGVSKTSLSTILVTTRCDVTIINERHDTLFGGRLPTPSSKSLNKLRDIVVENNHDMGIATDGDADRIGIIDEFGNFIHPNTLLTLLYYYLLEHKGWRGPVVRNLSTTHVLDRIAKAYDQESIETPVGFKYISSGMEEYDAIIGGESSGGLTVKGHIQGKDGIYAAALLVEMVAVTKKSVHELVKDLNQRFGESYFSENAYRFTQEKKEEIHRLLFEHKSTPTYENIQDITYLDGLKIHFKDDSWISARFSGTEPVLRIFAEAGRQDQVDNLVKQMEVLLQLSEKDRI